MNIIDISPTKTIVIGVIFTNWTLSNGHHLVGFLAHPKLLVQSDFGRQPIPCGSVAAVRNHPCGVPSWPRPFPPPTPCWWANWNSPAFQHLGFGQFWVGRAEFSGNSLTDGTWNHWQPGIQPMTNCCWCGLDVPGYSWCPVERKPGIPNRWAKPPATVITIGWVFFYEASWGIHSFTRIGSGMLLRPTPWAFGIFAWRIQVWDETWEASPCLKSVFP